MGYSTAYCDEVVAAYVAGKSTLVIADEFGCSPSFVALELQKRKIKTRGSQKLYVSDDAGAEIVRRYESGESMEAIGVALGIGERRVARELKLRGIPNRPIARSMKLPRETREQIAARYAGESARSLAKEFGVAGTTVHRIVREFGGTTRVQGARRPPLTLHERKEMVERYEAGESQRSLGEAFGLAQATVSGVLRTAGVLTRGSKQIKGELHPSWKGGRYVTSDGYVRVRTEEFPEMRGNHPYIGEHRLVMARQLGRPLSSHEQVHHKNGNKADNRIENLELRVGPHGTGSTHAHCKTCTCFQH